MLDNLRRKDAVEGRTRTRSRESETGPQLQPTVLLARHISTDARRDRCRERKYPRRASIRGTRRGRSQYPARICSLEVRQVEALAFLNVLFGPSKFLGKPRIVELREVLPGVGRLALRQPRALAESAAG